MAEAEKFVDVSHLFTCAGCGRSVRMRTRRPEEMAEEPCQPPPDWHSISYVAQDPKFGGVTSLVVFACTDRCAESMAEHGQGAALPFVQGLRAFLAANGATNVIIVIDAEDEEDEEDEYADEEGPKVPTA